MSNNAIQFYKQYFLCKGIDLGLTDLFDSCFLYQLENGDIYKYSSGEVEDFATALAESFNSKVKIFKLDYSFSVKAPTSVTAKEGK
jgi:hypothetical protein